MTARPDRADQVAALRAAGRTRDALALLWATDESVALLASVGPEVLLDAGCARAAREMLARGRTVARAEGCRRDLALAEVVEAKAALRADRDLEAAQAALDRALRIDGDSACANLVNTWLAFALLLEGRDEEGCRAAFAAVEGMRAAGDAADRGAAPTAAGSSRGFAHRLELPTAAVYLAEASWRLGDEAGADAAADLALAAAERQESNHILLQALHDFPAVLSRRLDNEPGTDSDWHDLGRALPATVDGPKTGLYVRFSAHRPRARLVRLAEFGAPAILVGDERVHPRIAKAVELLAFLAARAEPVHRDEALAALFDGRADDSARAYLRQAVGQLRRVLPGDDAIRVAAEHLALGEELALVTDSGELEAKVAEGLRLRGRGKLDALLAAIAPVEPCRYLPGVESTWAHERRAALAHLLTTARFEAAGAALAVGEAETAHWLNRQVLAAEPLREAAWRQRMRIGAARPDRAAITAAWRGCRAALAAVDAAPAPSTQALFSDLQASPGAPVPTADAQPGAAGFAAFPPAAPASLR